MRHAVGCVQESPGQADAAVELGCKMFGGDAFQAVIDKSFDASSHQRELHLAGVCQVWLSQDFRDVVGDNGLAEARHERARF